MIDKVDLKELKLELFLATNKKWEINYCIENQRFLPNCTKLDSILKQVINICKKSE